jgi:methylmalonyl-CoA mutase
MLEKISPPAAGACVLCGSDEMYREKAGELAKKIKQKNPDIFLFLAGRPGEDEDEFRAAGIDDFIYIGKDVYADLIKLLGRAGVTV